jgi:hypothetical protein
MKTNKRYICNKDFPHLGLEIGDYFPVERFTEKAIEEAITQGKIIEDTEDCSKLTKFKPWV